MSNEKKQPQTKEELLIELNNSKVELIHEGFTGVNNLKPKPKPESEPKSKKNSGK